MSGSVIRVIDLPDMGNVTDSSSVVADKGASTGRFNAPALKSYVLKSPVLTGLPTSPTGLPAGSIWNNGGVLCIV